MFLLIGPIGLRDCEPLIYEVTLASIKWRITNKMAKDLRT